MKFQAVRTAKGAVIKNRVAYQAYLESFEVGAPLEFDINKPKKSRNLSQNALFWKMIDILDQKHMHYDDKDKTKWVTLIQVGHCEEFDINGVLQKLPKTTSGLSKEEFADLINKIIRFGVREYQDDLTPPESRGY